MFLEILTLRAFEGPNICMPQPGLLLRVRADADHSRQLRDALKEAAQAVGLVIGFLECAAEADGRVLRCQFGTPQPLLAADVARYVVEGLNRIGDEEWDADGPLWALQKRRRQEASPLRLLQIAADARQRGLPLLRRPDGRMQIGYGARGWSFDVGLLALGQEVQPPWAQIGNAPVVAISGGGAHELALLLAERLAGSGRVALALDAGFDESREALGDQDAQVVILALRADQLVTRGVAFEHCTAAAIAGPLTRPEQADWSEEEHLRALGLPLLLASRQGCGVLLASEQMQVFLAPYAACPLRVVGSAQQAAEALLASLPA